MRFLSRKRGRNPAKLQMASMVDVVFQLLIFFLVASEVRPSEAEFKAELPAHGPPAIHNPVPVPSVVFRVFLRTLDGGRSVEVLVNNESLGRGPEAFQTLSERLHRLGNTENVVLVIDGDPDVHTQFVTNALDCAADARIRQVTFARNRR